MLPKSRIAAIYILLAATLVGLLLWKLNTTAPQGTVISSGQATIGGPFRLTNQFGKTVSDADFRGKLMMLYFGYSYCPDVCPISLGVMAEVLDRLGKDGADVVPIFITVDPDRDTPEQIKSYMEAFGPRFIGLTGSKADIANVVKSYNVYATASKLEGGLPGVSHSDQIYLMGRDGKFIANYQSAMGPDKIADEIRGKL